MKYIVVIFHMFCWGLIIALATCSVMFYIDKDHYVASGIACFWTGFFIAWRLILVDLKWSRYPLEPPKIDASLLTIVRAILGFSLTFFSICVFMYKEGLVPGLCLLSAGLLPLSPLDKIIFIEYRSILPAFSILPRNKTALILSGCWWCAALFIYFVSARLYVQKLNGGAIACLVISVAMLLLNPVAALLNNRKPLSEEPPAIPVEPATEPENYTAAQKEYLQLIRKGESAVVEFKSTLRVDVKTGKPEKFIQHSVIKTLAAFLNSQGGTLLIGVDDDKNIIGLDQDFSSFAKPDKLDEFQKYLDTLLGNSIGNRFHRYLRIEFPVLEKKVICAVTIKTKSGRPVYVTNDAGQETFYIRRLASTIDLKPSEIVSYIREHWS